jgi:hypothetical protein
MAQLFLTCKEAARRVSEMRDAPLKNRDRLGLWVHLAVCAHCRRYARQIRFLHSVLAEYPNHLSHLKLPMQARSEIVRKLERMV